MDPAVTGAVIGVGGAFVGAAITAAVSVLVQNREHGRQDEQTRRIVRQLYRNAFKALDGAMLLGYIDEPGRFEQVMQLLIDRVSRDDITTAFPVHSATMISGIPQLLDGLHGCMRAMAEQSEYLSGGPDPEEQEEFTDRIRQSAGAALGVCGLVLCEIGDKVFFNKNLSEVNAGRVLRYFEEERALQAQDRERDKAEIDAYRAAYGKQAKAEDSTST